jgi:hypothetical protein
VLVCNTAVHNCCLDNKLAMLLLDNECYLQCFLQCMYVNMCICCFAWRIHRSLANLRCCCYFKQSMLCWMRSQLAVTSPVCRYCTVLYCTVSLYIVLGAYVKLQQHVRHFYVEVSCTNRYFCTAKTLEVIAHATARVLLVYQSVHQHAIPVKLYLVIALLYNITTFDILAIGLTAATQPLICLHMCLRTLHCLHARIGTVSWYPYSNTAWSNTSW